jgi:TPR repeat protein
MRGEGVAHDPEKAVAMYRDACVDGGVQRACYALVVAYDVGKVIPSDYAEARQLYERACDLDEMRACHNLGRLYEDGRGVPKDPARAVALYGKSCDGGNRFACVSLGNMYAMASGVPRDIPRGLSAAASACSEGEGYGCTSYAQIRFLAGKLEKKSEAQTLAALEASCAAGAAIDCYAAGFAYEHGRGHAADPARAAADYARACEQKLAAACRGS